MSPVPMHVRAGEAEAATAVRSFSGPCHMLRLAFLRTDMRVAAMRAIGTFERTFRRNVREYGRDLLHILAETHVIVPLVIDAERLDAACNRMLRKLGEFRCPVRIDRPVH